VADDPVLTDTSDMIAIHDTIRRAIRDAPGQIKAVGDGDTQRARRVAEYLTEVFWLLQVHHEGEDELLYPLLEERLPQHKELFSRMEAQHASVCTGLDRAARATEKFGASGSAADGRVAADACESLLAPISEHLLDEEVNVLKLASRVISPPEWGALPSHALSQYRGDRVWLPFGLALEPMSHQMRDNLLSHLPPPVLAMWTDGGSDAFAEEMAAIRGDA
jgi:hemerythrin-like domain-containing protein